MAGLIWGGGAFLTGFLAHLALWRIRLPARQSKALFLLMCGVLLAALVLAGSCGPAAAALGWPVPVTAGDFLHAFLIGFSLILSYLITYSALEADSPSLVIIMAVAGAGPGGLAAGDLGVLVNDDKLLKPRLRDLVLNEQAVLENGLYRITPKGRLFALLFRTFRILLGRGKGG